MADQPRPLAAIRADLVEVERRRRQLRGELTAALKVPGIRASRWKGDALAALERDYRTTTLTMRELAVAHSTSAGCICNLANDHGWTRDAVVAKKLHAIAERHAPQQVAS